MPKFPKLAHVAVTVTDLERSTHWYSELFGAAPVLDEDEQIGGFHHTVFAIGGGQLFGLHTHTDSPDGGFDERRTGLDHVSFACRNRDELATWAARLDEMGIVHGGSWTPITDPESRSATPMESRSSSSRRLPDPAPWSAVHRPTSLWLGPSLGVAGLVLGRALLRHS